MVDDYGLIGGLGQGIQQGLLMYQKQKQLNRENQIQNLTSGLQTDADGNLQLTDQAQLHKDAQAVQDQAAMDKQNAGSDRSKSAVGLLKAQANSVNPGSGDQIPDMSEDQVKELGVPLQKPGVTNYYAMQKQQANNDAKGQLAQTNNQFKGDQGLLNRQKDLSVADKRSQGQTARIGLMQGNQAFNAMKGVNNDKILVPLQNISNKLDKGDEILSSPNPSVNRLHEVAQDYSSALNNGQISSDFKLRQISTDSFYDHLKQLEARVTANPDQPAPADEVAYWKKFGESLKAANNRQMSQRAQQVTTGMSTAFQNNPQALKAAQEAAQPFISRGQSQGLIQGQPSAHPQDQAAIAWAQSNPKDPRAAAILKANGVQ